jgi:asparagine synthase (glutamine-hydrolysing)
MDAQRLRWPVFERGSVVCGIAGIVAKGRKIDALELKNLAADMALTMAHRGPDDYGVWVSSNGRIALSHRRLSIIDTSSGGHQPMLSADGRSIITFNGEIYNFLELKEELRQHGEHFSSNSDTEVLLRCLDRWGPDALARLDAMFAFAHYDLINRRLLLARDIFGEKPLYYCDHADYFAFASELHALTILPGFDPTIEADAIGSYLAFQYVPAPKTIYRAARKLLPAHWLTVDDRNEVRVQAYFKFVTSGQQTSGRSLDDLADELESILITCLRRRLISDVPLGAFLSGGVDSSTVAAITTRKLGIPLKTYSIGFEGHKDSEHLDARRIAQHLGTSHSDRLLAPDAIELGSHIGKVMDEPNGDTSCLPTFLLSQFARENVTVALSGDGGDELFGGYGRYFVTVDEWHGKRKGIFGGYSSPGAAYISSRLLVFPDAELKEIVGEPPAEIAHMLGSMRTALDTDKRPLLNVLRELDARTYMPGAVLAKVDRMSMQHSLEVRAPLLGIEVARFAMGLAADDCYAEGQGKLVLKRVATRYLPRQWMMAPKRGFGIPMDLWGSNTLLPALHKLLLEDEPRLSQWLEPGRIASYMRGLKKNFQPYRAWSLFLLETWLRTHPAVPAHAVSSRAAVP